MQRLKDIKSKYSVTSTRKGFLKLKHNETNKQLKDCGDMRRVCQHLMPNTSTDLNQQRLRENLNIVTDLRRSPTDKKQVNLNKQVNLYRVQKIFTCKLVLMTMTFSDNRYGQRYQALSVISTYTHCGRTCIKRCRKIWTH